MKANLMETLKYFEKVCMTECGKHCLWVFIWSMVRLFLVFQPDSTLKQVVYFVALVGIFWQLLMVGRWTGRHDIIDMLHKAAKDSCKSELTNGGDKDEK